MKFVHLLSKEARRSVINVIVKGRGLREASSILGVTQAAVSKYRLGATHPSDSTLERALAGLDREELREVSKIMFEDLKSGFESLIDWMADNNLIDEDVVEWAERTLDKIRGKAVARRGKLVIV
ncbi:MAG: transcriptional regulator [Acidilobaceae archaeon]